MGLAAKPGKFTREEHLMEKRGSKHSSNDAVGLIEQQLKVLAMALDAGAQSPPLRGVELKRRHEPALVIASDSELLPHATMQRVLVSNALLAIGDFLSDHHIDESRAPEIQFLARVRDAIRRGNVITVHSGEPFPEATFGGLKIDASDNGKPLFRDEDASEGLLCIGDAVALMQRVAEHLRGMRHLYSAGDAG
jgi:hypothetical protein